MKFGHHIPEYAVFKNFLAISFSSRRMLSMNFKVLMSFTSKNYSSLTLRHRFNDLLKGLIELLKDPVLKA